MDKIIDYRTKLQFYGQEHLLKYSSNISLDELDLLFKDLDEIDFDEVNKFCQNNTLQEYQDKCKPIDISLKNCLKKMEPLPQCSYGSVLRDKDRIQHWKEIGYKRISEGKVAVILLAGGQGTRLCVDYPKGIYDVGLLSGKTLFQIQAERLQSLQNLVKEFCGHSVIIPWYIMTSEHTKDFSKDFFIQHSFFGLNPSNVIFFEQSQMPCIDFNGKIMLSMKHRINMAPGGNGGIYKALKDDGVLIDMEKRGIKDIHVYCVDNILVRISDPVFTGFCFEKGADCGGKVVKKIMPSEPVGVFAKVDGKFKVVEYSELSFTDAEKRDVNGELTYCWGSICIHFYNYNFLKDVCTKHWDNLPYHVAKKKIPYLDDKGERIIPTVNTGIKMEKFIFDVFPIAENFSVLEVVREDEFSPLKNAPGVAKETPFTCRASLYDLHYRYILKAGGVIVDDEKLPFPFIPRRSACDLETRSGVEVEICPSITYAGEGLEFLNGISLDNHFYLHKKDTDLLITQPLNHVMEVRKRRASDSIHNNKASVMEELPSKCSKKCT